MTRRTGAAMTFSRFASSVALTAATSLLLPACLIVRTTEHHIKLNKNGGGEAMMRLVDIRSDARTDSLVARDYAVMMASVQNEGVKEFEKGGRKVKSKLFYAGGDTLSAEIVYSFPNLEQIEGLKIKKDELFIVVNEGREIVRTNGSVKSWIKNGHRIVWPRDATRLMYVITETALPPSVSLASLYRQFGNSIPEGGH
jgi:hypothetical protein